VKKYQVRQVGFLDPSANIFWQTIARFLDISNISNSGPVILSLVVAVKTRTPGCSLAFTGELDKADGSPSSCTSSSEETES